MFESNSGELIKKSEALALQEIEKLSHVYGEVLTKNEIIDRIKDINKSIALYDLLVESDTFTKLIGITNQQLPKVKDRIYSSIIYLYAKLGNSHNQQEILEYIKYSTTLIFSWDSEITKQIQQNLSDLNKFVECKDSQSIQACSIDMIKKYKFRNDLYEFAKAELKHDSIDIQKQYLGTIAYIEKIGPLVSIYETMSSTEPIHIKKLDLLISIIKFALNQLNLDSFSIPHIIPSLMRSIVRKEGYEEHTILTMNINEVLHLTKKDEIGEKLIELAQAIVHKDKKVLINSRSGERLFIELQFSNFWDKLEYLPELSLLEHISEVAQSDIDPAKEEERHKLSAKAGELGELLYGKIAK
jgi:hypothetical protein